MCKNAEGENQQGLKSARLPAPQTVTEEMPNGITEGEEISTAQAPGKVKERAVNIKLKEKQ